MRAYTCTMLRVKAYARHENTEIGLQKHMVMDRKGVET